MSINCKLLIVDNDVNLCTSLEKYLYKHGFQVRSANNVKQMERLMILKSFQLIILGITLPNENALSICHHLRLQNNLLPIIIMTANDNPTDRIDSLEIGADDSISKPFNWRELLARIKAVLRRQENNFPGTPTARDKLIQFGQISLNLGTRQLFKNMQPIPITSSEYAMLKAFVDYPRIPLSRDKLMNLVRLKEYNAVERSIDVQISRLRRIIESDPGKPRYIQTVWGLGYIFIPDSPPNEQIM